MMELDIILAKNKDHERKVSVPQFREQNKQGNDAKEEAIHVIEA